MIHETTDVAVLGAGFAGSLMALVLQRIGRQPLLIERGTHPRCAVGESSTPLANLILEELSRTYDLPRLFPFTEYGRWQQAYPKIACGLKRGFTFIKHQPGQDWQPAVDHANELLVAASPTDEVGDTHWFREEFDHFLVQEAQAAGIPYFDRTDIAQVERDGRWRLRGSRNGEAVTIDTSFLIDATGPSGLLSRQLGIDTNPVQVHTNSWSVYTHFTGVGLWEDLLREKNVPINGHPYRCDDAALHHILPDGWMWVLRFNNGITSAGFALDCDLHPSDPSLTPEAEWQQIIRQYPSIARQFAKAKAIQPWVRTGRLQRRAACVAGPNWAMLPHAAYFLDPLFSTGIAHTLLGIERLAAILKLPRSDHELAEQLAGYQRTLFQEIEFVDWLVHGCYRTFDRFDLLAAYTMYYFAAAVQSEERRRNGMDGAGEEILFSHHAGLRTSVQDAFHSLTRYPSDSSRARAEELHRRVRNDISQFNPAGFCDAAKRNMYPFVPVSG